MTRFDDEVAGAAEVAHANGPPEPVNPARKP